jgi:REP element-mobilizing transposase RayT
MNSYRQILYHIVFCTYCRQEVLPREYHEELYKYIWGIINNRGCVLYRINGTENHIHILSDLNPMVCLSDYIKEIKTASNRWMKQSGHFPYFQHWAEGSCALTYNLRDKDMIANYIKRQKEHHLQESFEDEYKRILAENGIQWDERYIF